MKSTTLLFLSLLTLSGCANLYEGIRESQRHPQPASHPASVRPTADPSDARVSSLPSYEQYKREVEKLKGNPAP